MGDALKHVFVNRHLATGDDHEREGRVVTAHR